MKILIIRYTDQPAINICKNIAKYSKHSCRIITRDEDIRKYYNDYDVLFYYNANDVIYDNRKHIYKMLQNSNYQISIGVQSHRVLDLDSKFMPRIKKLDNIIGLCAPVVSTMEEVKKALDYKDLVYGITPFSADKDLFKPERDISSGGKLKVGYVGSDTPNKRFNDVIKPALNILKDEVEPLLYGKVGKRKSHDKMCKEYNKMDCLVVSSIRPQGKAETGPMPPMEAALCGRPTITTRCGLMPETFDDTQAIFHDGTVDSLVSAIKRFINSRKLCKEMGENARKQMLNTRSWENLVKMQDKFFEDVYERKEKNYGN